jgi:hypothetical protein
VEARVMLYASRLPDVLGPVRDLHVAALLETLARELDAGGEVDAEPVDRTAEGRILRRQPLNLPSRRDLRSTRDGRATTLRAPGGRAPLSFAPISVEVTRGLTVRIAPFDWSRAQVSARAAAGAPDWTPVRRWFLEWFQARYGEESPDLLGVVHRLDGPEADGDGWRFTVDLGSASVAGFAAMLGAFAQTGCAEIRVGETEAAPL